MTENDKKVFEAALENLHRSELLHEKICQLAERVDAVLARNAELAAEVEAWKNNADNERLRADEAEARVRALEEALKPFGQVARSIPDAVGDSEHTEVSRELGQAEDDALMASLGMPRNENPKARTRETYCLDGLRVSDWRTARTALEENRRG